MNCIVIDDEILSIKALGKLIENESSLQLLATFSNPVSAKEFLQKEDTQVDLVFLDIRMPLINGMTLAKSLKIDAPIIFTTSDPNFAVEAFEVNALDYLLKPIDAKRFKLAIGKALKNFQLKEKNENGFLYLKKGVALEKVKLDDILYGRALGDQTIIQLKSGCYMRCNESISSLCKKNKELGFIRVHRSFFVYSVNIDSIHKEYIMAGDEKIPIGRYYKDNVLQLAIDKS